MVELDDAGFLATSRASARGVRSAHTVISGGGVVRAPAPVHDERVMNERTHAWLRVRLEALDEPRPPLELNHAVIQRAMTSKNGVAWERLRGEAVSTHVFAVTHDAGVTVGVGQARGSKLLEAVWPSLAGWNPEAARRWAHEAAADRLTLALPPDDAAALLEAVRASPDDDQPRLVFADWLLERGDVHGELIRLQLQEAEGPLPKHAQQRVKAILAADGARIAGALAPYVDEPPFHRGFVERVRMTPEAFTRDGARFFAKYPLRTWVVDDEVLGARAVKHIATAPGLGRVWRMELTQGAERSPLAGLARGRFSGLHALGFRGCGHSGEDWFELFSKLDAPELEHVDFAASYSHPLLLLGLATNPKLTKLSRIDDWALEDLGHEARDTFAAAARALAANRPALKTLILSRSGAHDDEALHPLFAPSSCVELEVFDLDGAGLSDASLRAWQRGGRLGRLKTLSIRDAHFTPQAVAAFIAAGVPPKLEALSLTTHDELRWNSDGIGLIYEALLALPSTTPLKRLSLPPVRRGYDRLWQRVSQRFEVTA